MLHFNTSAGPALENGAKGEALEGHVAGLEGREGAGARWEVG